MLYRVNLPRPHLETRSVSYRKLKQIDNSAFSNDLKNLTNALLNVTDINQLVGDYNTELRQLLDRHTPMKSKTIVVRPLVPWFGDELKSLKSQRRKAELVWRRSRNHETLLQLRWRCSAATHDSLISSCFSNVYLHIYKLVLQILMRH